MPWRQLRQFCLGALGWCVRDFEEATLWDVCDAQAGYVMHMKRLLGIDDGSVKPPMLKDELLELMKQF